MANADGTTKYALVRQHLHGRVQNLAPGTKLPSEAALCAEYQVSRVTLRHAVDQLIRDGLLVREQGTGTFVTEPTFPLHYRESFADQVRGFHAQLTGEGQVVATQVLAHQVTLATTDVASALRVPVGEELIDIHRLRFVNGHLHHLVRTWLPARRFPGLVDHDLTDGSLFGWLAQNYDVHLRRNDVVVSIAAADTADARLLQVDPGTRLLLVTSTVFDDDDRTVAHGTSLFTPDNSELTFSVTSAHDRAASAIST